MLLRCHRNTALVEPAMRSPRGLKEESGFSSLAKLPFQISHFLISVLGYIIALSRLPFNIYSVLDCNRFILHYFAEIKKKKKLHIFSQQEQCMVLTQAFLTPNILLLFLHTLLDNVQI